MGTRSLPAASSVSAIIPQMQQLRVVSGFSHAAILGARNMGGVEYPQSLRARQPSQPIRDNHGERFVVGQTFGRGGKARITQQILPLHARCKAFEVFLVERQNEDELVPGVERAVQTVGRRGPILLLKLFREGVEDGVEHGDVDVLPLPCPLPVKQRPIDRA